jgi:hypothetical protein
VSPRARALASGLVILGLALGAALWRHPTDTPKAVARPRPIDAHAGGPPRPFGPLASELLPRQRELGLEAAQVERLVALDREWQREGAPLEAEARTGEVAFERFMDGAVRGGRGSLAEIQRRAAEQGERGAAARAQRAAHAGAVRHVLTDAQWARWAAMTASRRTGEGQ